MLLKVFKTVNEHKLGCKNTFTLYYWNVTDLKWNMC